MQNAFHQKGNYRAFYEQVGENYPETALVHSDRSAGTRYWTVLRELESFARRNQKMLDVGCNDGVYTIPYCKMGGTAVGVDISNALIEKAKLNAAVARVHALFWQFDIDELSSIAEAPFDLVLCSEVLEHLLMPDRALQNISNLIKPGAYLILTTPTPLFEITPLSAGYVVTLLWGKKLVERQFIDSTQNPLNDYGIAGFHYRHDGYYPLCLSRYVERFGFRCVRRYTINFPVPRLRGNLSSAQSSFDSPSVIVYHPSTLHRLRLGFDLVMRRIPLAKLFGRTNIQVFKRR